MYFPLFFPLLALSTSFFISMPTHAAPFVLNSTSFVNDGTISAPFTCDGGERSPELNWSAVPSNTHSFTLIVTDPDAPMGTWTHWVAYNIPAASREIPEGANMPAGSIPGSNSWGRERYNGPCPPNGIHRYIFTLYALDINLNLGPGADAKTVQAAMQGHVLGKASILGVYGH